MRQENVMKKLRMRKYRMRFASALQPAFEVQRGPEGSESCGRPKFLGLQRRNFLSIMAVSFSDMYIYCSSGRGSGSPRQQFDHRGSTMIGPSPKCHLKFPQTQPSIPIAVSLPTLEILNSSPAPCTRQSELMKRCVSRHKAAV
jgi:hypothetical protein